MNFLWISFATLSIFALAAETIEYGQFLVNRDIGEAPLVLIKKSDSAQVNRAIPQKYLKKVSVAVYNYITKNEDGPTEEIFIACPAYTENQLEKQNDWKKNKIETYEEPKLFFLLDTSSWGMNTICRTKASPGIRKADRKDENGKVIHCGQSKAETYEVGFWVSMDKDAKDVRFVAIYEICHSTALAVTKPHQGTLYTTHRIDSPSLMLTKLRGVYGCNPLYSFRSFLDKDLWKVNKFYRSRFIQMFVGRYDMPTEVWEYATLFPFNYIPIPRQQDLRSTMMRIDNYIRLFTLKSEKPLKVYSGIYETPIKVQILPCASFCERTIVLQSFWRILIDDESNAVLLVTQYSKHTLDNCGDTFICSDGEYEMLRKLEKGGCAYMCPVKSENLKQLGLPPFDIKAALSLEINFENKSGTASQGVTANINDFMNDTAFVVLLRNYDSELAATYADSPSGVSDTYGSSYNESNYVGYVGYDGAGGATYDGGAGGGTDGV